MGGPRGAWDAEPKSLLKETFGPRDVRLAASPGHQRQFLDCVRTRGETVAHVEAAHRSASVGHLGQIAMRVGRKITWNPDTEEIVGDPEAERLLGHSYRKPWQLPE